MCLLSPIWFLASFSSPSFQKLHNPHSVAGMIFPVHTTATPLRLAFTLLYCYGSHSTLVAWCIVLRLPPPQDVADLLHKILYWATLFPSLQTWSCLPLEPSYNTYSAKPPPALSARPSYSTVHISHLARIVALYLSRTFSCLVYFPQKISLIFFRLTSPLPSGLVYTSSVYLTSLQARFFIGLVLPPGIGTFITLQSSF